MDIKFIRVRNLENNVNAIPCGNYRKAAGGPLGAAMTNYIFGKQPELEKAVTFSANLVAITAIKKEAEKRAGY